jgi:hypothetical protein
MLLNVVNSKHKRVGAPEGIRTPDTQLRKLVLLSTELQARVAAAHPLYPRSLHPCIQETLSLRLWHKQRNYDELNPVRAAL